jgi:TonB-dependent starch-binding outer membrane protein SusC
MKRNSVFFRALVRASISLTTLLFIHLALLAQNTKEVSGVVTNAKGEPLPGVNILVKGSTKGTVSDVAGKYTITVTDKNTLVFSSVGFTTQEIEVKGQTAINVLLEPEDKTLSDVVVVGYGTQKKVNVIGSVVSVSSKDLAASPVGNVTNAIAGRLPGAVIQQTSGEPGNDGASILIRGQATLGNNEPLVVIDGIPGRDLNSINSNDIESFNILKDASAAIYGARAANGVILITTKKGSKGTPLTVNYNFYQGWVSPTRLPKMADAATYAQMLREAQIYNNTDPSNIKYSEDDIEKFRSGQFPWTYPNTDWFKASLAKYSLSSNHNVSVSGGNQAVTYFISFGTQKDGGIFKNSATSYNRYNIKAAVDAKLNEYLSVGVDVTGIQENKNYPSVGNSFNFDAAVKSLPTSPAYYPNGLPGPDIAYGQNPVVSSSNLTGFDNTKRYRANTILSATLKIPGVKGLSVASYYAYDLNLGQRKLFQKPWVLYQLDEPAYLAAGNTGAEDGSAFLIGSNKGSSDIWLRDYYDDARTKTFNIKADYTRSFGDHNVSAFVSYEYSDYNGKGINAYRRNLISDQLPYLFAGADAEKDNAEFVSIDARKNYFGRLSYDFKGTYLFQFSFRRDGSLRFSKESGRWGSFPGVLAGWIVSNENFWKDNIKAVNFFKLKASWGILGNDAVKPFQYLSLYSLSTGAVLSGNRTYYAGLSQAGATNPDITWETANVYNAGFESNWFNNSLIFNADFFYQRRNNILVQRNASVPTYTGIILPDENYGIVDNKGFEVVLGYRGSSKDFSYSITGNLAFARNKVIEFDEPARNVPWQRLTGHPQGTQLLYKAIGIFKDDAQVSNMPHVDGARPGDVIIEDINKDGEINSDDRILYPKTVNPEITYGINFSLSYKNFTLSGLIQGAGDAMRRMYYELQGFAGNYFEYDADGRWTPDNINASKPRSFDRNDAYWRAAYVTSYSYQNAAYARLKNLQLSYSIPANIQKAIWLKGAQIYVSGQNLFLLYSGNKMIDPELGGIKTGNSGKDFSGSEFTLYPIMKTIAVGARITL